MEEGDSGRSPWFKKVFHRITGGERPQTADDVERSVHNLEEQGLISIQEGDMIESLLEFGETLAREIMVPRIAIHALPVDASVPDILEAVEKFGHSRLPVYEEDVDRVLGLLHVKDALPFWGAETLDLRKLMRPVLFIPETKRITDLLSEMRKKRGHLAVVIDEYGGTAGILTIEDILEEIVGEIQDEHDSEDPQMVQLNQNELRVDARLDADEVAEYFSVELPKNGFDTVGGFLNSLTGQVPQTGEVICFGPLEFVVEESDERRIKKVKVRRTAEA